jgi:hemin uptake protein HemP
MPDRTAKTADVRAQCAVKRVLSAELFENSTELIILHAGREYRLRVTNNGKLLLTA